MSVSYDVFTGAFLSKVSEFDFVNMRVFERNSLIDGYMKRAIAAFRKICKYDLSTTGDDVLSVSLISILPTEIWMSWQILFPRVCWYSG